MRYVPHRDPDTGMITMVLTPDEDDDMHKPSDVWEHLLGTPIPDLTSALPSAGDEAWEVVLDLVAQGTVGCFDVSEGIAEQIEMLGENGMSQDDAVAVVKGLQEEARKAHAARIATWEGPTSYERLDAAFTKLEAAGIVARHDLGMSLSDGEDQVDRIVEGLVDEGREIRGSLYYHRQDLERVIMTGDLQIAYTSNPPAPRPARLIGEEIAAALAAEGLDVDWNGSERSRIGVNMVWRRRPA